MSRRPPFPRTPPGPLRRARLAKGWTLDVLGEAAHLSVPYVSALELGQKPGTVAAWAQLARALGVSVGTIRENSPASGNAEADPRQLEIVHL